MRSRSGAGDEPVVSVIADEQPGNDHDACRATATRAGRLTLVISSLGPGGAEQIISVMANYWVARGYSIDLLTFDDGSTPPFFDLNPGVRHRPLGIAGMSRGLGQGLANNLRRIWVLRRAIRDTAANAVISFCGTSNVLVLLAGMGLGVPILVSERSNPAMMPIGRLWALLRWRLYPFAARVVVQTEGARRYFDDTRVRKLAVVPNPVPEPARNFQVDEGSVIHKPSIVAMGRLSEEKRLDLLIEAFAGIAPRYPNWTLTIFGDGPLRANLEDLRHSLGLNERVFLPGIVKNFWATLARADLFVLCSRFEGFPNSLCAAMACGVTVIATDCPNGPADIIRDGLDGMLVPVDDGQALSDAMEQLINDPHLRARLGRRAPEVVDRFGVERIMQQWNDLLDDVGVWSER